MWKSLLPILPIVSANLFAAVPDAPLVIAHRGASGYLPEHTLEAKVLAFAQGADYLEQDVVMTADDALVVFHDLTLERVTDVAARFPGRARDDGGYYVIDFTLDELRELQVGETQYPTRFPAGRSRFAIHTLQEELELIAGLQRSTGRAVGIYPELKSPWFHHQHGKDLAAATLRVLKEYGYDRRTDAVFVQSFDYAELVRVHDELLPALGMDVKLVQLIAENAWQETFARDAEGSWVPYDYDWMRRPEGLRQLARIADGVGPAYAMLVDAEAGSARPNGFAAAARAAGLAVHPYTFRSDALPSWAASFEDLLRLFIDDIGVDGVFTDFPDKALYFLQNTRAVGP
ncbi:MAG: glycerophosphodiester phosphodiesterase [Pseudomonadota bacterium]|nr:glycerophosphodiester phosphodiesterase [Pseudomonadota bacterium]